MTTMKKVIKYLAIAFAVFLIVVIAGGILGAAGVLGNLFKGNVVTGEMKTYSVNGDIHDLEIRINAADLCIKEGEAFSVESNLKNLKVEETNGRLVIKDQTKIKTVGVNSYKEAVLTVYVPVHTVFERIDLTTGAGRLNADRLSADALEFELGAGEISISSLNAARYADIEGGAGQINISGGVLNNLDLEMGVGQLNLTSALTGDCQLESGVGESNITLLGNQEDFRLEVEKGIGSITVDGVDVSDYRSRGNGANKVEIHGGVGAVNVKFEEEIKCIDMSMRR